MRARSRGVVAWVAWGLLAVGAPARAHCESAAAKVEPVPIAAADLAWNDLDPEGAPGVQIAPLWGDHRTGGFGAFLKLPAGFAAPLHTHSHDMRLVFVSGTYLQAPEGEAELRLGPGSYLLQPGGDYRHTTSCDPAADCVFFVESDGPFDLFVVDAGDSPARD